MLRIGGDKGAEKGTRARKTTRLVLSHLWGIHGGDARRVGSGDRPPCGIGVGAFLCSVETREQIGQARIGRNLVGKHRSEPRHDKDTVAIPVAAWR